MRAASWSLSIDLFNAGKMGIEPPGFQGLEATTRRSCSSSRASVAGHEQNAGIGTACPADGPRRAAELPRELTVGARLAKGYRLQGLPDAPLEIGTIESRARTGILL
jgi:hypothetical protein